MVLFFWIMTEQEKKKDGNILIYLLIFLLVILIRTFIITPVMVNGDSMNPTLEDNDIMILNKINYKLNEIKRFDIVVIKQNNNHLIKRIIGLPNEKVMYQNNTLYINCKKIEENYKIDDTYNFISEEIPSNCYFVLGDNRNNSTDSRTFGFVKKEDILGSANLVIFPFNKFGLKT